MKECTTHHNACDCRERTIRSAIMDVRDALCLSEDWSVKCAMERLCDMWKKLYGKDLMKEYNTDK